MTIPYIQCRQSFSASLAYGVEGEHIIAQKFINNQFAVMPLYQFTASAAPMVYFPSGSLTSPDLMVYGKGKAFFVEVKKKRKWARFNGKVETGCNWKLYEDYKHLAEVTGMPCYIIFIHEGQEPNGVYMTDVSNTVRHWDGKNRNGGDIWYTNEEGKKVKQQPEALFTSESLKRLS